MRQHGEPNGSREARRQEDGWRVRGRAPRAVQAPQGPTDGSLGCSFLAFLPLASHGHRPFERPHPLHQSPSCSRSPGAHAHPCHHAPDSLLPISGSMVPSELSSAHPPLLPGVTSKHYFPNSCFVHLKSFAGPHLAVSQRKVGWELCSQRKARWWFWVWAHPCEKGKTGGWHSLSTWASGSAPPCFMSQAGLHSGPHQEPIVFWHWVGWYLTGDNLWVRQLTDVVMQWPL